MFLIPLFLCIQMVASPALARSQPLAQENDPREVSVSIDRPVNTKPNAIPLETSELSLGKVFCGLSVVIPVAVDNRSDRTNVLYNFSSPNASTIAMWSESDRVDLSIDKGSNRLKVLLVGSRISRNIYPQTKMFFNFRDKHNPLDHLAMHYHTCKIDWKFDDRVIAGTPSLQLLPNSKGNLNGEMILFVSRKVADLELPTFSVPDHPDWVISSALKWHEASHPEYKKLTVSVELKPVLEKNQFVEGKVVLSKNIPVPIVVELTPPSYREGKRFGRSYVEIDLDKTKVSGTENDQKNGSGAKNETDTVKTESKTPE